MLAGERERERVRVHVHAVLKAGELGILCDYAIVLVTAHTQTRGSKSVKREEFCLFGKYSKDVTNMPVAYGVWLCFRGLLQQLWQAEPLKSLKWGSESAG